MLPYCRFPVFSQTSVKTVMALIIKDGIYSYIYDLKARDYHSAPYCRHNLGLGVDYSIKNNLRDKCGTHFI